MTEHPAPRLHACASCAAMFADQHGLWQHTKAKHGPKAARAARPPRPERELSYADELVDAIQAAHAGEPVPEHLFLMDPEQFPRGTKVAR